MLDKNPLLMRLHAIWGATQIARHHHHDIAKSLLPLARDKEPEVRAQLLHAVASHHDARAARTAEAAVLVHANQLDAVAATRPVPEP